MERFSSNKFLTNAIGATAFVAVSALLLGSNGALAHGSAAGGGVSGFSHPLIGIDHLLMLMAVGTAAALISIELLLWAFVGAVLGAGLGLYGMNIGFMEILAAIAISAVGLLMLFATRFKGRLESGKFRLISGLVVSSAVGIHALLHGLEAPQDSNSLIWWSGALLSSTLVCGASYLICKKFPVLSSKKAALIYLLAGAAFII